MRIIRSLSERFHEKYVVEDSGCWRWIACTNGDGYGMIKDEGGRKAPTLLGQRASWKVHGKVLPEGTELDHLCKNRWCVNPEHLEAVTHRENIMRGASVAPQYFSRAHCAEGHPFAGGNLILRSDGGRGCRICTRVLARERMARWRASRPIERNAAT